MRLLDPNLNALGRQEAAVFANDVLDIGNATTTTITVQEDGPVTKAPWKYGFLEHNTQAGFIDALYPDLQRRPPPAEYLGERAILAVTNEEAGRINLSCMDRLQGEMNTITKRVFLKKYGHLL
ncbi:MAG: hypothetical protein Q9200_005916 [Gallowayella weberi]